MSPAPQQPPDHDLPLRLDRYFRWRGTDVSRVEAFSDAAFAFALTLLLVGSLEPTNFGDLRDVAIAFLPFALTFLLLAMVWRDHYVYFRRYDLRTNFSVTMNFVLLFLVLLFTFPLKLLFTALILGFTGLELGGAGVRDYVADADRVGGAAGVMTFYGLGFASIYIVLGLMYRHAGRLAGRLALDALERHLTRTNKEACYILATFGIGSSAIAQFAHPAVAGWSYFGIAPVFAIYHFLRGRHIDRLYAERLAGR